MTGYPGPPMPDLGRCYRWHDVMHGNDTTGYTPARQCQVCGEVQLYPLPETANGGETE